MNLRLKLINLSLGQIFLKTVDSLTELSNLGFLLRMLLRNLNSSDSKKASNDFSKWFVEGFPNGKVPYPNKRLQCKLVTIFWHFLSLPYQTRHLVFFQLFISQHFVFNCINRITLHEYMFTTKGGWIAHYANLSYLVFDAFADEFKLKALNLNSCESSIVNVKYESIF